MTFKISDGSFAVAHGTRFRELLEIEEEVNCDIGAGYDGIHLREFFTDPKDFQQVRQFQAIVLAEFQALLEELNLGIGKNAAFACGRNLVIERLMNPTAEIQEKLWTVLQEKKVGAEASQSEEIRTEINAILKNALTQEDWTKIAAAAAESVRDQVLEYRERVANVS
ncbi:hypothetical protein ACQ4M3_24645 [Leptolyngbya sp. AN03gr2]